MKCPNCNADILDDIEKCPFCKYKILAESKSSHAKRKKNINITQKESVSPKQTSEFDFTYTITSKEQIDLIRQAVADLDQTNDGEKSTEVEVTVTRTPKNTNFEEELRKIKEEVSENYQIHPPKRENAQKNNIETETIEKESNFFAVLHRSLKNGKRPNRKKNYRISMKGRRVLFFGICAALLLCLIVGGARAIVGLFKSDTVVLPSYYIKENRLLQYYNGTESVLTEQLYLAGQENETAGETVNSGLVHPSENGVYTYFFENFDRTNRTGDLMTVSDKQKNTKTKIASDVSPDILIADNGKSVLFIQNGNIDGNMGTLQYWSQGMQETWKIASDMDSGNFVFSQNGKQILFIEKFNTTTRMGDLYLMDIRKEAERQRIDTDVCEVFGTDVSGKYFLYGQNYDAADKSYDIYVKTIDSEKRRIADHTALPPIISKQDARLYTYGALNAGAHNLYRVDLKNQKNEKIASDINGILKISEDETQVLFYKIYNTGYADYYICTEGQEAIKVADNVNSFVKTEHTVISQFAVSDDFSRIAYISGFDPAKESGALYVSRYRKGKLIQESKKITDEAYSCTISRDGSTVWYASNYSVGRKVTDLYLYNFTESRKVADEVPAEQFTFGKLGNTIAYLTDYNAESGCGRLTVTNKKLEKTYTADDVAAFGRKENDDIIFFKEYNQETHTFDLYFADADGNSVNRINTGVQYLLSY